jgi:chloramphenicol 3-O-phosphotransferase
MDAARAPAKPDSWREITTPGPKCHVRDRARLYDYQVIIWLNGTFGAGKTSTAERLAALVPGGRVFDPQTVGDMLRVNLGDRPVSDYQDWSAWRAAVAATLAAVAKMTDQHVVAAQTVLKQEYLDEIFEGLRAAGMDVFHVVLDAADAVLRSRIEGTEEAREWRLADLDDYEKQRPWMVEAADLVVDTAASTPAQNARRILTALPGIPDPPPVVVRKPQAAAKPATATAEKSATDEKPATAEKPVAAEKPMAAEKTAAVEDSATVEEPAAAEKSAPVQPAAATTATATAATATAEPATSGAATPASAAAEPVTSTSANGAHENGAHAELSDAAPSA